jgi:hypothetical protein
MHEPNQRRRKQSGNRSCDRPTKFHAAITVMAVHVMLTQWAMPKKCEGINMAISKRNRATGKVEFRYREQAMKAEQAGRIARKSTVVPYTGDLIERLTALTDYLTVADMEANETIDQLERA